MVLIHGLGASMYSWRKTIGPLAEAGFRVIAFDNRGFGGSEKPERGYANADYVRLTLALLDSLGIAEATLVGHSMGGQIAAEVALARPERVRALALLAPSGLGIRHPLLLRAARWRLVGPLISGLRNRTFTARILRSAYGNPAAVTDADVDQYYAPVAEADYGRALRGVLREYRFDGLAGRLDSIHQPTLLVWGSRDRWIPPSLGRVMAGRLERVALVMIPGAGHALGEEAPERVNAVLVRFLTAGLPRLLENLAGQQESGYRCVNRSVDKLLRCAGSSAMNGPYAS
ncbi:MAG TPA: alpha/beta hydrolase [Gemmatimonadales bacterium]|nr:alpha/beta hydrolase [Gemmatimonadales bacterium]